jgi:hypothetical protein
MTERERAERSILQFFAAGQQSGIGRFTANPDGRWWWDDVAYRIFGYQPGDLQPSWNLIIGHIPAFERQAVEASYTAACSQVGAFSWSHTMQAGDGTIRSVLLVGDTEPVDDGSRLELSGYLLDLTDFRLDGARAAATAAVQNSARYRAVIEQAKGALMLAYHLDEDAAFALLTWNSQQTNRKLHAVAATLMAGIQADGLPTANLKVSLDRIMTRDPDAPART